MRPVEPGPWPLELSGEQVVFNEYGHARPNLTTRLGHYCSYCEMRVNSSLAIEHVVSKSKDRGRERDWSNFLLACPSCNSCKGDEITCEADTDGYLWPHRDRTFDVFDYRAGFVRIAGDLDSETRAKAEATEALVGLMRDPQTLSRDQLRKGSDRRYHHRRRVYQVAARARRQLERIHDSERRAEIIETIRDSAEGHGFWSVWMTVFAENEDVQAALCEAFPGTAKPERIYPLPKHLGPTVALTPSPSAPAAG